MRRHVDQMQDRVNTRKFKPSQPKRTDQYFIIGLIQFKDDDYRPELLSTISLMIEGLTMEEFNGNDLK